MEDIVVKVDGKEYAVFVEEKEDGKILVHCGSDVYEVETKKDAESSAIERLQRKRAAEQGEVEIKAPLPGIIYDVKARDGEKVKQGQSLFTLVAMKMENDITSPKDGIIKETKVKKNDSVNRGDVLAIIE